MPCGATASAASLQAWTATFPSPFGRKSCFERYLRARNHWGLASHRRRQPKRLGLPLPSRRPQLNRTSPASPRVSHGFPDSYFLTCEPSESCHRRGRQDSSLHPQSLRVAYTSPGAFAWCPAGRETVIPAHHVRWRDSRPAWTFRFDRSSASWEWLRWSPLAASAAGHLGFTPEICITRTW